MTRSLFLVALAACQPTAPESLPADALAPPVPPMLLSVGRLVVADRVDVQVYGALPGSDVTLYRSDGGIAAGACPAFLLGDCFDIGDGTTGQLQALTGRADRFGTVRWSVPRLVVPEGMDVALQAVSTRAGSVRMSNAVSRPTHTCEVDALEPDDVLADATDAVASAMATVCPDDPDWYEIEIPPGWGVVARAEVGPDDGLLSVSTTQSNPIEIAPGVFERANNRTTPVTSYFRVDHVADLDAEIDPFRGVSYVFEAELVELSTISCTDALEPNDATGASVPPGAYAANVCRGDVDRYDVPIPMGSRVRVRGLDQPGLRAGYTESNADIDNVAFAWSADAVSFFVQRDLGFGDDQAVGMALDYAFTVEVLPGTPCTPDALEPDDTAATATTLLPGTVSAEACATDRDWFAFDGGVGDQIDLVASDDIQLRLYDPSGALLEEGPWFAINEIEDVSLPMDGRYTVEAFKWAHATPGVATPYTLDFSQDVPANCPTDAYEPNDTQATAALITGGVPATGCVTDEDWYAFEVTEPESLDVGMQYNWMQGQQQARVRLYRPDGTEAPRQTFASQLGTWTIHADTTVDADGGGIPYTLRLDRVPLGVCTDDAYEPNDARADAADLGDGALVDGMLCLASEDWYVVSNDPFATVRASVDYDPMGGEQELRMELRAFNGALLSFDEDPSGSLSLSHSSNRDVWVRVMGILDEDGGGVPYTLDVFNDPPVCASDAYEPNDDTASATPLPPGDLLDVFACPDVDVYQFDALAGEDFNVFLNVPGSGSVLGTLVAPDGTETPFQGTRSFLALQDGTYFVEVREGTVNGPFGLAYNVGFDPIGFCPGPEPDDTLAEAPAASSPWTVQLCDGVDTVDTRYLDLTAGDRVDASLNTPSTRARLELVDSNGQVLATGAASGPNELDHTVPSDGRYYLRVTLVSVSTGTWRLTPTLTYFIR